MKFEAVPLEQMPTSSPRGSKYDAILDVVAKGEGVQVDLTDKEFRTIWFGIKRCAKTRGIAIKTYRAGEKLCVVPKPANEK